MAKKVLIISTSLRGGSNSEVLARECERGAKDAGLDVEYISLKGKNIQFCIGCLSCQSSGEIGDANDAGNHKEIMKKAYELGKVL